MKILKFSAALFVMSLPFFVCGQSTKTDSVKTDSVNVIRTASNLASGNFKDVLTSFFQLAYNDLTSDNREFNFSSNIFAIRLKTNPSLNIDKNFIHQTFARNSNINFSIKLDSNFKFNGVKGGYKYAIVNARDYAISRRFNALVLTETRDYTKQFNNIVEKISGLFPNNPEKMTSLTLEMNAFFNNPDKKYKDLSDDAKKLVDEFFLGGKITINDSWNPRIDMDNIYKKIIKEYENKMLWTIGANFSTYSDGFLFSNIDLQTEVVTGVVSINDKNNIELNIKGKLSFGDDTTQKARDLKRQVLTSDFGFNWVTRNNKLKPVAELTLAGSFNYIPNGIYLNEKKSVFMLAGTLRVRVSNDIWLPFEIKYDPDKGNVFGFLSVRANFDWMNKLFGVLKN